MYNRIRQWEPWLVPFIPQQGDVAFDVGAAEGRWTLDLAERFKTVVAVEPHPDNYEKLKTAIETSHPSMMIIPLQGAVARRPGSVELQLFEDPEHTSMMGPDELDAARSKHLGETQTTRSWTLEELVFQGEWAEHTVDFVKVDTEGAEFEVLMGAGRVAKEFHPVWLVEYHNFENMHGCQHLLLHWEYKIQLIPHPNTSVKGHGWIYAS